MAQNENDIIHVYNLYYQKHGQRTQAISCSSLHALKLQAIGIIIKSEKLEPRFKLAIELFLGQASTQADKFERVFETYQAARIGNKEPLEFDLWWDDEPQVLL